MIDKALLTGSTTMLILKLLESKDMYGYEMIEQLDKKSNNVFKLKAGTLYPLLHSLQQKGAIESYELSSENARTRIYYTLTDKGKKLLKDKKKEWKQYNSAINNVLGGFNIE